MFISYENLTHHKSDEIPHCLYYIGLECNDDNQIYFEKQRQSQWSSIISGFFVSRNINRTFDLHFTDRIDSFRRDFLCYLFTHDYYFRHREPPAVLGDVFSVQDWQEFTHNIIKLSSDATNKLRKLDDMIHKNPKMGYSMQFKRWQKDHLSPNCFEAKDYSDRPYPGPWNPCLRHILCLLSLPLIYLFLFLIYVPAMLYILFIIISLILVFPVLTILDCIYMSRKDAISSLNELSEVNAELDMAKINESISHGLQDIANTLNRGKLRGTGIVSDIWYGKEFIPATKKEETSHYKGRYLVIFRKDDAA